VLADRLQHLAPVDLRQVEVQQHDRGQVVRIATGMGAAGEDVVQRLGAVAHHHQAVGDLGFLERDPGQLDVVWIVLDEQDFLVGHVRSASAAGSARWMVVPAPGRDSASMRPPCRSTMRLAMARPMPLPAPSSAPCRRWNGSNSLGAYCMSKPRPWSRTVISSMSPTRSPRISSASSPSEKLQALRTSWATSIRSWRSSPCTNRSGDTLARTSRGGAPA